VLQGVTGCPPAGNCVFSALLSASIRRSMGLACPLPILQIGHLDCLQIVRTKSEISVLAIVSGRSAL